MMDYELKAGCHEAAVVAATRSVQPIDKTSIKTSTVRNVTTFPFVYSSVSRTYIILKPFIQQNACLYHK